MAVVSGTEQRCAVGMVVERCGPQQMSRRYSAIRVSRRMQLIFLATSRYSSAFEQTPHMLDGFFHTDIRTCLKRTWRRKLFRDRTPAQRVIYASSSRVTVMYGCEPGMTPCSFALEKHFRRLLHMRIVNFLHSNLCCIFFAVVILIIPSCFTAPASV